MTTNDYRLPAALAETMLTQRSLRRVLPGPVDDELVLECVRFALQAPTAFNRQAWDFVIVRDPETKKRLGAVYREVWPVYRGIVARDGASPEQARGLLATQWQVEHFEEIPVLVVACLTGRPARHPAFQSAFYGSIYPAVQNFLLTAVGLGLGAAPVTMALADMAAVRRILGIPAEVLPCCLITLGWPVGHYGYKTRRPVNAVTHFERYGQLASEAR
jgi:nitroreductase